MAQLEAFGGTELALHAGPSPTLIGLQGRLGFRARGHGPLRHGGTRALDGSGLDLIGDPNLIHGLNHGLINGLCGRAPRSVRTGG